MNFGRVQGGVAANVVAETATANIATRLAAGTPDLVRGQIIDALKNVKAAAQKEGGDLEVQWGSEGYGVVDINCDIEGFETMTVNYGTDVPWLSGDHKRYLYGPGSIFVAHSDHEALKRKLANTRDQVSPPVPDITPSPYLCPDEQTLALELQSFTDGDR